MDFSTGAPRDKADGKLPGSVLPVPGGPQPSHTIDAILGLKNCNSSEPRFNGDGVPVDPRHGMPLDRLDYPDSSSPPSHHRNHLFQGKI